MSMTHETRSLRPRTEGAEVTRSVCPYCAVGCGQLVFHRDGKLISIEGDPESPISEGQLCPKGAATFRAADARRAGDDASNTARRVRVGVAEIELETAWTWWPSASGARARGLQAERDGLPLMQCTEHRASGRRDARQRRELPDQEAVHRRASGWSRSATRPAYDIAPRCPVWAPRSGAAARRPRSRISQCGRDPDHGIVDGGERIPSASAGWSKARETRARLVIHVDPRFTPHVRDGRYLGAAPRRHRHRLLRRADQLRPDAGPEFREYVVAYTNAAMSCGEEFRRPEDLDGLFSGLATADGRQYDTTTWQYELTRADGPRRDPTLQHPRSRLSAARCATSRDTRRRWSRRVCGIPRDAFLEIADAFPRARVRIGRRRSATRSGWTQHSVGVQIIRAAAILQLLLGNIGRPGGGILALRGHASIQGSTDIPTLYDMLPGYLPMPAFGPSTALARSLRSRHDRDAGWWSNFDKYIVSLLKAWYGDEATARERVRLRVAAADYGRPLALRATGSTWRTGARWTGCS